MTEPVDTEPVDTDVHEAIYFNLVQYGVTGIERPILDASVHFPSGSLIAIMGPSGSGKTTMLNLLAGRIKPSSGNIVYTNPNTTSCGYVMQKDILTETDTVEESLEFAYGMSSNKGMCIDDILITLGLDHIRHSVIGSYSDTNRGISGGEKKRVAISQVLISNPDVLVLDEPTSGLDSITAEDVIKALKQLIIDTNTNTRMVVCTIHQPSSEIFHMFDHLILLSKGRVIYEGRPSDSMLYFAELGHDCPIYNNPADYYMSILKDVDPDPSSSSSAVGYNEVPLSPYDKKEVNDIPITTQLGLQIRRQYRKIIRDPYTIKYRVLQNIVIGIVYGALFWQLNNNESKLGAIFYMIMYQGVIFAYMTAISSFPFEIITVMREQLIFPYGIIPYMIAKTIIELPLTIICAVIYLIITNAMIGLIDGNDVVVRLIKFVLISILLSMVGQTWGYVPPSLFKSREVINAVTPIMTPFIIMGGYFTTDIPIGAIWLYSISFIRWSFQSMAGIVITDMGNSTKAGDLLDTYDIHDDTFWKAIVILISEFIILRIVIMAGLYHRKIYRNNAQE